MTVAIEDPHVWQRIVPYLDRALDLPPAEAGEWLDDLECAQPQIAALVRELLAERDMLNAIGFLEGLYRY